jgi:hypothetical protein
MIVLCRAVLIGPHVEEVRSSLTKAELVKAEALREDAQMQAEEATAIANGSYTPPEQRRSRNSGGRGDAPPASAPNQPALPGVVTGGAPMAALITTDNSNRPYDPLSPS